VRHVNYTLRPLTSDNAKPREKAYALTDGGGLMIEVLPSGTKTWRFKYHLNGKREKGPMVSGARRQVVERTRPGPEMER
jgi:hypothetical protein